MSFPRRCALNTVEKFCNCKTVTILTVFLLLASFSHIALSIDQTKVAIEWRDLIPDDWEAPLILPAPDSEHAHHVDKASLNADMSGRKVKLPGYMKPVKFTGRQVTEFLLVPFLDQHTQRHLHHDPNQMVYVKLIEPVEITDTNIPYWISGDINLESVPTNDGPTGYVISNASTELYLY